MKQGAPVDMQLERRLKELTHIGIALTSERNLKRLLDLILTKARQLTRADAGSLYLVERPDMDREAPVLRFVLAQNDSVDFTPPAGIQLPLDEFSISGFVALTGKSVNIPDVYQIGPEYPFQFNPSLDERTGYRTCSMLTVPLSTQQGEIIGVLQLINRKTEPRPLRTHDDFLRYVQPFTEEDQELLQALASQAAIAIENNRLIEEIEQLFESFIRAAVLAVEQRDPTTKGHSVRVARLTTGLAEAVSRTTTGPYKDIYFEEHHIKEIHYAALLHDFGKIGVREYVLVKAEKLYPEELERIRYRFHLAIRTTQWMIERKKVEFLLHNGLDGYQDYFRELDQWLEQRIEELRRHLAFIEQCNQPTVLPEGDFSLLHRIGRYGFLDVDGIEKPLLTPREIRRLSIPKGSLDEEERNEIESHVTRTYEFLCQIPWSRELRRVPEIAYAHHEKMDGTGYPRGLRGTIIPIQSRMMTIADIYDALAAQDRPYKRAVPPEEALEILATEVEEGKLDADLFQIFRDQRIWELTLFSHPKHLSD